MNFYFMGYFHKQTKKSGFTLIELLVVMLIIGILGTVVLALLANARKKGVDGGIKQELASLKSQAELYYNDNGYSYNLLFTTNNQWASGTTKVQSILTAISNKTTASNRAGSGANAWAAQAQLKLDTTQYACVSNVNRVTISTTQMAVGATACP
jgi:prepilin-type N-terminal cleavage/methylation domain-containing protein